MYFIKLFTTYSMIFFLLYSLVLFYGRVRKEKLQKLYVGLLLVGLHYCIYYFTNALGWNGLPNGRYILAGFVAFYFGWMAAIPFLIYTGVHMYFIYPQYVIESVLIVGVVVFVFQIMRIIADREIIKSNRLIVIIN